LHNFKTNLAFLLLFFYGPPGTGKTTLAKVIANTTSAEFLQMNATSAGKMERDSKAPLTSKYGFSVVAPIRIIVPSSTKGRR